MFSIFLFFFSELQLVWPQREGCGKPVETGELMDICLRTYRALVWLVSLLVDVDFCLPVSARLSVCVSVCHCMYVCPCVSLCSFFSVCLSVCFSVCVLVCLSVIFVLSVSLSANACVYVLVSICLFFLSIFFILFHLFYCT